MTPKRVCEVVLTLCVVLVTNMSAAAAPIVLPDGRELAAVDFDRHVQPLLNKLGCNAGACHGSAKGRGDFFLSLFSGSPAADYEEITRAARGRRIDFARPDESLLLRKATGQSGHQGGPRLNRDSWEYRLLRQWIAAGATRRPGGAIVRLEAVPAEHLVTDLKQPVQLRVVAEFADGTREDVTPFTDFRTPEPGVVKVTPNGEVRALKPGFAPVLSFYRNHVAPVRALVRGPAPPGFKFPDVEPVNAIDREVLTLLKRVNLPPAKLSGDAEFLRRACIDVAGRLPTPDEVRTFLAGTDPDKRRKKIDELLNDPPHAALWATKFTQITRMRSAVAPLADQTGTRAAQMWYGWFRTRVRDNVPVDRIFRDVLLATSREGRSPEAWIAQVRQWESTDPFRSAYRERATLDLFWQRPDLDRGMYLEGMADTVAGAFLGVPLQCASCHHHPLGPWSQADRRAFGLVLGQVKLGASPEAADVIQKERKERERTLQAELDQIVADAESARRCIQASLPGKERDLALAQLTTTMNAGKEKVRQAQARLRRGPLAEVYLAPFRPETEGRILGGPAVTFDSDAREQLYRWLTSGDDPRLARVFVNRVWKHYFGKGLVEPDEVVVAANPPTIPALLDALTRDFAASGYDLRKLERTILLSRTYQLSSVPVAGYENDQWFPSRSRMFRPTFPVVMDTVADALGGHDGPFPELPGGRRFLDVAIHPPGVEPLFPNSEEQEQNEAMDRLFGRTEVVSRCREEGSGWLAIHSYAGPFNDLVGKSKRLKPLLASSRLAEKIAEELFLATLSRLPTPEEMRTVCDHVAKEGRELGKRREELWSDVLWALLNTKEFVMRR